MVGKRYDMTCLRLAISIYINVINLTRHDLFLLGPRSTVAFLLVNLFCKASLALRIPLAFGVIINVVTAFHSIQYKALLLQNLDHFSWC